MAASFKSQLMPASAVLEDSPLDFHVNSDNLGAFLNAEFWIK